MLEAYAIWKETPRSYILWLLLLVPLLISSLSLMEIFTSAAFFHSKSETAVGFVVSLFSVYVPVLLVMGQNRNKFSNCFNISRFVAMGSQFQDEK